MAALLRSTLAVFLSSLLACGGSSPSSGQPVGASPTNVAGRALYAALFFGQGQAATLFPEVWGDTGIQQLEEKRMAQMTGPEMAIEIEQVLQQYSELTEQERSRLSALADRYRSGAVRPQGAVLPSETTSRIYSVLLDRVATADPSFFDRFGTELKSGDELKVSSALAEGSKQMRLVVSKSGDQLTGPTPALPCENCDIDTYIETETIAVVALVFFAVEVVFVALAAVAAKSVQPGLGTNTTNDLQYATFVANITARFNQAHTTGQ